MRDKEGAFGRTVIALVLGCVLEDILENTEIPVVDGASEGDGDHLWCLFGVQVTGDACAVHGAETTFGPKALTRVTYVRSVGVSGWCCGKRRVLVI